MENHNIGYAGFGDDEVDHQETAGSCQAPRQQSLSASASSTSPPKATATPSSPRFAHCCSIMLKPQNATSQCSVSVPLYKQPLFCNVHAPCHQDLYLLTCSIVIGCLQFFWWILTVACLIEQPVSLPCTSAIFERPTVLMIGSNTIDSQGA